VGDLGSQSGRAGLRPVRGLVGVEEGGWVEMSEVPMPWRPLGSSGSRCDVWGPASFPLSLHLCFPSSLVWLAGRPALHVREVSNPSLCLLDLLFTQQSEH